MAALFVGLAYAADLTINLPLAAPTWQKILAWITKPIRAGLPRPVIHVLFLLAVVALAYLAVAALVERRRRTLGAPESAVTPTLIAAEPTAPAASVADLDRLREVALPWQQCLKMAIALLNDRILCARGLWVPGDREARDLLVHALNPFIVQCRVNTERFSRDLAPGRHVSQVAYEDLLKEFRELLMNEYQGLMLWIKKAGSNLLGGDERLRRGAAYAELHKQHQKATAKMQEVSSTQTFGSLAKAVRDNLADVLPTPIKRVVAAPGFEESPQDLVLIAAWEGYDVVVGRGWFGKLNVQNVIPPGKAEEHGAQLMLVCSRPGDDVEKGVFYVRPADHALDLAKRIVPKMEITGGGILADPRSEGREPVVTLSHAEFVNTSDLIFPEPESA